MPIRASVSAVARNLRIGRIFPGRRALLPKRRAQRPDTLEPLSDPARFVLDYLPEASESMMLAITKPIPEGPTFFAALETAAFEAYRQLLSLLELPGLGRPIRIWNFIPAIHARQADGTDAYMAFNHGRRTAWSAPELPPAATGIGHLMGESRLEVYCIISPHKTIPLENPRQIPAYRYSAKFGPKPPMFSRGLIHLRPRAPELLISGTASVLGEETAHPGDPEAQTAETLRNLEALVSAQNLEPHGFSGLGLRDLDSIQAYIRDPRHSSIIRGMLERSFPGKTILCAQAEICREDLLVEVEAVATLKRRG